MKKTNEFDEALNNNFIKEIVFIRHSIPYLKQNNNLTNEFIQSYKTMTDQIEHSFNKISHSTICYDNPRDFQSNIDRHKNAVVISIWGVGGSRNKKTLIPSICESSKIPYVGGDTHVQALCQDKYLSNLYAKAHNIHVPNQVLYTNNSSTNYEIQLLTLNYPVIVKPLIEGESIGISSNNICYTAKEAYKKAIELNRIFQQDILVEEMLEGDEINIIVTGINDKIDVFCEILIKHDQNSLDPVYTYEKKRVADRSGVTTQVGNFINEKNKKNIEILYKDLQNVEILRVDGKMYNGEFKLIEFTQDPGLAFDGVVHKAFKVHDYSYESMLKYLLDNAMINHRKY